MDRQKGGLSGYEALPLKRKLADSGKLRTRKKQTKKELWGKKGEEGNIPKRRGVKEPGVNQFLFGGKGALEAAGEKYVEGRQDDSLPCQRKRGKRA